ncbi:glycylpeptide N-tetradecanoyltransferase [Exophiala viscosa]|uniref:glycylpeptide N-tetradecanoyltransferase n=1 Tax=Exophiala viscosa TaxID=2486360 RepID=UPI00219B35A1|nr:glycylpeptide N-tetradecanoyltransferase [Exophiala viscosa]
MRAILPGRPQSKRQALSTAHWDGLRLVAYISGNAAVLLSGPQTIIQTIYVDTVDTLTAITIEETTGRIALCDADHVYIYRPVGREEGVLRWSQIHELESTHGLEVTSLSWGSLGELLLGGSKLVLWHVPEHSTPSITWEEDLAYPTAFAYLSPDSSYIASVGRHDRLAKIWRRLSFEAGTTSFDVSYLPHPAVVTNVHWRKPWHLEQNLDSLLYTFCADNQVRAYTTFDPHALSVMQLAGTIDMNASIQPRRLSVNSMSTRRFAFVIDSRDFAIVTEQAVRASNPTGRDHALEHLIEIANRSPELCIVLDGLGHMSVWGLENAGYKNKIPSVFHICHVDGMAIHVPQLSDPLDDYIQFCIFGGGTTPSSLSILLHSFAGDIDWYDSQITHLFDTAMRQDRTRLISSLAGHGAPVQRIVRNVIGTIVLSATDEGHASLWQHGGDGTTAPLLRRSSFAVGADVKDAIVLSRGRYAAILTSSTLELWDVREAKANRLGMLKLDDQRKPERITQSRVASDRALTSRVIVGTYPDGSIDAWEFLLPAKDGPSKMGNGYHEIIRSLGNVKLHVQYRYNAKLSICDNMSTNDRPSDSREINALGFAAALVKDGFVEMVKSQEEPDSNKPHLFSGALFETNVRKPRVISASGYGKVVVVNEDSTSLSIWDAQTGAYEFEHEMDGTDTIRTFAWAVSPSGQALMALCFDYHIVVLAQSRYSYSKCDNAWIDIRHIRIRDFTTHSIGDLCWLRSGDLVVGSGTQFFIFEGYAKSHHNQDSQAIKDLHRLTSSDSTFAVISVLNSLLPVFHPTVLSLITSLGGLEHVKPIILRLHRDLKFFSEGDQLPSFLSLRLENVMEDTSMDLMNGNSYHGRNGANGDVDQQNVSDIVENLVENLKKHELWQLNPEEQSGLIRQIQVYSDLEKQQRSVDPNGQRYLHALYASGDDGVAWSAIVFASLSSSQEVLVDLVTRFHGGKLTWEAARKSGLFCWLSDAEALRLQMENVARAEFTKHEDRNPIDSSLYYFALRKKNVLQGLWRMAIGVREKENTIKLLANNFNNPRWKASALKNAYALLSRRRFHYAAAFFLLGDSLWDAVNVCIHQLKDLRLAIAIARVYEADHEPSTITRLVEQVVLPQAVESEQGRWIATWAYSILGQSHKAVQVLVQPVHVVVGSSLDKVDGRVVGSLHYVANDPLLVVLYLQVRNQAIKQNTWHDIISAKDEWSFIMRCVRQYLRMGCDVLALALVRDWEFVPEKKEPTRAVREPVSPKLARRTTFFDLEKQEEDERKPKVEAEKKKPPPTQFVEPSADSLLDSFGF